MDFTARILFVILSLLAAVLFQTYRDISKPLPAPKLDLNEYWGPADKSSYKEDSSLVVNRLTYPDEVIEDLSKRLERKTSFHEPLEGAAFEYGFNSKKLQEIINYWRTKYLPKWKKRELYLWQFPHYTTQIQGLRLHYLHTKVDKPEGKTVYPVLLLHGWPGSVREFYDVIPKLSLPNEDKDYVFEVVVPSLPGYGWSQGASKPGMGPPQIAVILRNLMLRLGYDKFFIQGGDWGSAIGSNLATLFPENVIGFHSNLCFLNSPMSLVKGVFIQLFPNYFLDKELAEWGFSPLDEFTYLLEETGYMHIQATKPDTIGAALTDNPVGLAAYILEKFSTWTNPDYKLLNDGGLEKDYSLDALLDNVMIYYLTNSITTSQRLYAEAFSKKQRDLNLDRVLTTVPTGCAQFKNDMSKLSTWQLKDKFVNLIHSTFHEDGGHFIAFQKPDVLYKDFIQFVDKVLLKNN